jgi:hypothetical protein
MGELSTFIMCQYLVCSQHIDIVEFCPDQFYVRDLKKGQSIVLRVSQPKDSLYKFCELNQPDNEPNTLVSHTDERSRTWHE